MEATAHIARFVVSSRYDSMPAGAIAGAKTAILDCLGTALAGSLEESGRICAEIARQEEAREDAAVYGQGFRTSALQAAFANGTAAHAADFDHSFVIMGQPTAPIIPASVALAEAIGASGRQVLEAYVTGFEVTARLAFALQDATSGGWHANNSVGGFGATAACARLLGLDEGEVEMALGIAASQASGLNANFGTMTKPLHVGLAARNGVLAAKLASSGFTANATALEAGNGFFGAFYKGSTPNLEALEDLGRTYAIETNGVRLKPYPCGGLTHTAIYATLKLREQLGLTAEMIESVDVDVPPSTARTIAFQTPETALQGKFCTPYLIARAIVDGAVTLDTFTEAAVRDESVLALASRITQRPDESQRVGNDGSRPATITVHLRNGQTHSLHEEHPKGSPQVPMSAAELEAKFRDCARDVISDASVERVLGYVARLESLGDITPLCQELMG